MAGKYWVANNPNSEITDAKAQQLKVVSATASTAAEIDAQCDNSASTKRNTPVTLLAGGAGNDTTIQSLASGKIYHFGTGTGAVGNADDDDTWTMKLPTPAAAGEEIIVYPTNAAAYAKLLGFVCNAPATETITYYAVAQNVFIESASTATGTAGTDNVFVRLNASHFILGMVFKFTSLSTTVWRLDIDDPLNLIASGDINPDDGHVGGYTT